MQKGKIIFLIVTIITAIALIFITTILVANNRTYSDLKSHIKVLEPYDIIESFTMDPTLSDIYFCRVVLYDVETNSYCQEIFYYNTKTHIPFGDYKYIEVKP